MPRPRPRRTAAVAAAVTLGLSAAGLAEVVDAVAATPGPRTAPRSSAAVDVAANTGGLTAQPVLGFPGTAATIIGASPGDAANPGEVWAEGDVGAVPATAAGGAQVARSEVLVRRTDASGNWQVLPVQDGEGDPLATGWTAAQVTPDGAVVLAGDITAPAGAPPDPSGILVHEAGSTGFSALPAVPANDLQPGESLGTTSGTGTPIVAADDGQDGADVFLAPQDESADDPGLLHFAGAPGSGRGWQREPICATDVGGTCTAPSVQLTVDAISVSSASNAWMVATPAAGSATTPQLYERETTAGSPAWVQQPLSAPLVSAGGLVLPGAAANATTSSGPIITASGDGVWLDLDQAGGGGSATLFYSAGQVLGTWCTAALTCPGATGTLPAPLPGGYGSAVTTPASGSSPGTRTITGLAHGAMMTLSSNSPSFAFQVTIGGESESPSGNVTPDDAGGNTNGPGGETIAPALRDLTPGATGGGEAFSSATDAWIGIGGPTPGPEVAQLTSTPTPSSLASWPLPAQTPLLAIAGAPGQDAASGTAPAVAVGVDGEVERFTPGAGWATESLLGPGGAAQTPTLRGVAWPTASDAYAVGDDGAMWRWQASTGEWGPDPGAPPGLTADLTAVAFSSTDPGVGYAVGKDGTLLAFSSTTGEWQLQAPPAGLAHADFSSVTFAGGEAIAAYRLPPAAPGGPETGGLIVDTGGGWAPDPTLSALFSAAELPPQDTALTQVAGLPDGGAVAAGPGIVVVRDSSSAAWQFSPTPLGELDGGAVSALAAYRDAGGTVRAIVSVDPDPAEGPNDVDSQYPAVDSASPPDPDPLPNQGFVVKETADGWVDTELEDYPGVNEPAQGTPIDQPGWPDGVFALLVDPSGDSGWAVGGQTGGAVVQQLGGSPDDETIKDASEAGSAARFGAGPAPPVGTAPADATPFQPGVTIAIGGGQGCNAPCADDAEQGLGPDVDLSQAISEADDINGLGAFVYVGRGIGYSAGQAGLDPDAFARELTQFSDVLSGGGPGVPVYATPNGPPDSGVGGDIQPPGNAALYEQVLGAHDPVSESVGPPTPPGTDAYAVDIDGSGNGAAGGTVRLIVLDFSAANSLGGAQLTWLTQELSGAHAAGDQSIVVGADNITDPGASNYSADGPTVRERLLAGGASAYVFNEADEGNSEQTINADGNILSIFGTGALGYGQATDSSTFDSGFLLLSLATSSSTESANGANITTPVGEIPDVGQVSLDDTSSTPLQSGQTAVFTSLARRVQGGGGGPGTRRQYLTLPPDGCRGESCFVAPVYSFASSNPAVGEFVAASNDNPNVPETANGKFIPLSSSPLFCAFTPGTTTLTIDAGGATYSEPVTITQGAAGGICDNPADAPVEPLKKLPAPPPNPPTKPRHAHRPTPRPRPRPHRPVVHRRTAHPAPTPVHHHHHPQPSPTPAPPAAHHVTPVPPAPSPPPVIAPGVPPVKSSPLPSPAPARPIPPPGVAGLPTGVAANTPVGTPVSAPAAGNVPLNVSALDRRSTAEVQVERATHSFAAYEPHDGGMIAPGIALLLAALGGGAAAAAGARRLGSRGTGAAAAAHVAASRPRIPRSSVRRR